MDLTFFFEEQQKLLQKTPLQFVRSIYHTIDFDNRLIALLGQRGVGKTTLMLQLLKLRFFSKEALYISVDTPYFATISLFEFAKEFEKNGGEVLLIDKVHKYRDFASHIKAIYDSTDLQIVLSGSSLLQIYKEQSDLSRRIRIYNIPNLSFREYLELQGYVFDRYSLDEIVNNHFQIASSIVQQIKPIKYLKRYLVNGAYPFILEGEESYPFKLINIINHILEVDLPYVSNINYSKIDKIKKLLYLIATSVPFTPNINKIAQQTGIARQTILEYLYLLDKAQLLMTLHFQERGYSKLQKPDKIYLNNTNLIYAITGHGDKGAERETFFVNQIKNYFANRASFFFEVIFLSKQGDFLIGDRVFEIGGKNKTKHQIKSIPNGYLVKDDIEIGYKNEIPLWLFGFLY